MSNFEGKKLGTCCLLICHLHSLIRTLLPFMR